MENWRLASSGEGVAPGGVFQGGGVLFGRVLGGHLGASEGNYARGGVEFGHWRGIPYDFPEKGGGEECLGERRGVVFRGF